MVNNYVIPSGPVVRILRSLRRGPCSIPGMGKRSYFEMNNDK